jgi:hypothetical protein
MNKIGKNLLFLSAVVFIFCLTGCPALSGTGSTGTERAATPSVSIQLRLHCPKMQVCVFFSTGFGAVKTLEIYQGPQPGDFVKVATLTGLSGATAYYDISGAPSGAKCYVKALRSKDNVWYASSVNYYVTLCPSSSSSGSDGPGPGSSSTSSSSSGG